MELKEALKIISLLTITFNKTIQTYLETTDLRCLCLFPTTIGQTLKKDIPTCTTLKFLLISKTSKMRQDSILLKLNIRSLLCSFKTWKASSYCVRSRILKTSLWYRLIRFEVNIKNVSKCKTSCSYVTLKKKNRLDCAFNSYKSRRTI